MLVLLTDFGVSGPYIGQVKAVLAQKVPSVPIIDLFHDLPAFEPALAAALIPSYCGSPFPRGTVFMCIVDPGVGTSRQALIVCSRGFWYVGPDNGLLSRIIDDDSQAQIWSLDWFPESASATFHARDIFAPAAAALACGYTPSPICRAPLVATILGSDDIIRCSAGIGQAVWQKVVYIDHYGNAMTGIRGADVGNQDTLEVSGYLLRRQRTFGMGENRVPFWYVNSNGLVELAIRNGSMASAFGIVPGMPVFVRSGLS
ncbi:SAM-dependent chlorinase/fluorinase [Haematospirillum jordaniae]|uniref:SAM hydrolase/SAM-dependent halogenase family protein n=1 Tax=Haematospirillum jordaniae TaxID=1549855 RepID=UPI001432E369|nr:SAM-dependent chlorinase/fluorinase [Haematospirillum jordaniae]NKD84838.1 SAM-dependent chlorinase/fluorinase [Haematospirillum jordaniae]